MSKTLSLELNNVTNIETIQLDNLTIYIHTHGIDKPNNFYMSILSLNIINHPLDTKCIEIARSRCIVQLEKILHSKINQYNDNLDIINTILKKTN